MLILDRVGLRALLLAHELSKFDDIACDFWPELCSLHIAQFLLRLRRAVTWLNEHMRDNALLLSRNQKARAADVLKLQGGRTKW